MKGVKHRHHYVPCKYLRSWSLDCDGTIAVRFGNDDSRLMAVERVAFEDGGYSYERLNPEMLRSILCCRPRSKRVTDFMMRGFLLPMIVVPVFYRKLVEPANNDVVVMWRMIQEANLIDPIHLAELEKLQLAYCVDPVQFGLAMDEHQKEGYETMMCNIENGAWPILDLMKRGELGWLKDDYQSFQMFYYICTQRTRTPGFRKLLSEENNIERTSRSFIAGGLYRRYILAFDSAVALTENRQKFEFRILAAEGNAEFITGDMPVIDLPSDSISDCYFPLSPKRSFLFGPSANFCQRNVELLRGDVNAVRMLNMAIKRNSVRQVFGTTERVLDDL